MEIVQTKLIRRMALFSLMFLTAPSLFASETVLPSSVEPSADFNTVVRKAFAYGIRGQFDRSIALFQRLSDAQFKEWIVYDLYTRILELKGDFDEARKIYQTALKEVPQRAEEIQDRLSVLDEREAFSALMADAVPWEKARVMGSKDFLVKTNIPQDYLPFMRDNIAELFKAEKELFASLLGPSDKILPAMKIMIFGRWDEYLHYNEAKTGKGSYAAANYNWEDKELAIYFNGAADWRKVAHEMAHAVLRQNYIRRPSRFLDEGLAEYVSYTLAKEEDKSGAMENLEFMNWLYDQGEWENALTLFPVWNDYETNHGYIPAKIFYLRSWSLVYFFLEGNDPFFSDFFKKYIDYERANSLNSITASKDYFFAHLTKKQRKDLDQKWCKFCLNLTYEKI